METQGNEKRGRSAATRQVLGLPLWLLLVRIGISVLIVISLFVVGGQVGFIIALVLFVVGVGVSIRIRRT
jgi:hypothetical protein